MITLGAIYAFCSNGGIGLNSRLPWSHPEDIKHFWETIGTMPVICGYTTWSYAGRYFIWKRPASIHIVITREHKVSNHPPHAWFVDSKESALALLRDLVPHNPTAWICGGKSIYKLFENDCDLFVGSWILKSYECDTFLPWEGEVPPNATRVWEKMLKRSEDLPDCCVSYYLSNKALFSETTDEKLTRLHLNWLRDNRKLWH